MFSKEFRPKHANNSAVEDDTIETRPLISFTKGIFSSLGTNKKMFIYFSIHWLILHKQ